MNMLNIILAITLIIGIPRIFYEIYVQFFRNSKDRYISNFKSKYKQGGQLNSNYKSLSEKHQHLLIDIKPKVEEVIESEHKTMIDFKDIPFADIKVDKPKKKEKVEKIEISNMINDIQSKFELEEINLPPMKTVGTYYIHPKFLLKEGGIYNLNPGSIFMDSRKELIKELCNTISEFKEMPINIYGMYQNIGILNFEGLKELKKLCNEYVESKFGIEQLGKYSIEVNKLKHYQ